MLFYNLYEVNFGFGGTVFSENDVGGRVNEGTKKFQGAESTMDDAMNTTLTLFRKSEFNKPGFQFRQMYLQQMNKNKKKKKKSKEVKDMFSSDSDDDGKSRRNVTKQVDHIVHGITYCVLISNLL